MSTHALDNRTGTRLEGRRHTNMSACYRSAQAWKCEPCPCQLPGFGVTALESAKHQPFRQQLSVQYPIHQEEGAKVAVLLWQPHSISHNRVPHLSDHVQPLIHCFVSATLCFGPGDSEQGPRLPLHLSRLVSLLPGYGTRSYATCRALV
jgi:hypothetical protein